MCVLSSSRVGIASKYHWHDKIMKDVGGACAIFLEKN